MYIIIQNSILSQKLIIVTMLSFIEKCMKFEIIVVKFEVRKIKWKHPTKMVSRVEPFSPQDSCDSFIPLFLSATSSPLSNLKECLVFLLTDHQYCFLSPPLIQHFHNPLGFLRFVFYDVIYYCEFCFTLNLSNV